MGHQLLPGAVALFDALGFRGIWQRFPPSAIVTSLTNLRAQATIEASRASLFAHVFSDTIAIGAVPKPDDRDPTLAMHNVLDAIVDVVDHVVHVGLCGDPPLLFRGCIAVGELIATPEVLVGAPVDAASELYEQADAAIVWFAPGALDSWISWNGSRVPTLLCTVPLRNGQKIETRAINPLARFVRAPGGHPAAGGQYAEFRARTERTFSVHGPEPLSVTVARKRSNTLEFLRSCEGTLEILCQQEMEMLAAVFGDVQGSETDPA